MKECKANQFDLESALTFALQFIADLGQQWFELAGPVRLKFQKLLFPDGILYDRETGFGTARLGCIFSLYERWGGSNAHLVRLMDVSWNQIMDELQEFDRRRRKLDE